MNKETQDLIAAAEAMLYAVQILELDDRFVEDFFERGGRLLTAIQNFKKQPSRDSISDTHDDILSEDRGGRL